MKTDDAKFQQQDDSMVQESNILCIKGNQSLDCCLNQHCDKNAFICHSKKCDCQKQHLKCELLLRTDKIISKIQQQKLLTINLQSQVQQRINQTIDCLSELKDKLLLKIKQCYSFVGLSKQQNEFTEALQLGNIPTIMAQKMFNIWKSLKKQEEQQIKNRKKQFETKINKFLDQINSLTKRNESQIFKQLQFLHNYSLFKESRMVKNNKNVENIKEFFQKKKIKTTKLLYRASQNNFSVYKFHQKCDNIPNTIILVETEYDKIIGGYTPIIWNKVNDGYASSEQKQSFLFSLTNNHKFKIKQNQDNVRQIYCNSYSGPKFGGRYPYDLHICDKANQMDSSVNIGGSYLKNYYINDDRQFKKYLIGSRGGSNFKTRQWEVWSVQFF